jgi:hypothetical protein
MVVVLAAGIQVIRASLFRDRREWYAGPASRFAADLQVGGLRLPSLRRERSSPPRSTPPEGAPIGLLDLHDLDHLHGAGPGIVVDDPHLIPGLKIA